jgi:hypothetical protein
MTDELQIIPSTSVVSNKGQLVEFKARHIITEEYGEHSFSLSKDVTEECTFRSNEYDTSKNSISIPRQDFNTPPRTIIVSVEYKGNVYKKCLTQEKGITRMIKKTLSFIDNKKVYHTDECLATFISILIEANKYYEEDGIVNEVSKNERLHTSTKENWMIPCLVEGGEEIFVMVMKNDSDKERSGYVCISDGENTIKALVYQSAKKPIRSDLSASIIEMDKSTTSDTKVSQIALKCVRTVLYNDKSRISEEISIGDNKFITEFITTESKALKIVPNEDNSFYRIGLDDSMLDTEDNVKVTIASYISDMEGNRLSEISTKDISLSTSKKSWKEIEITLTAMDNVEDDVFSKEKNFLTIVSKNSNRCIYSIPLRKLWLDQWMKEDLLIRQKVKLIEGFVYSFGIQEVICNDGISYGLNDEYLIESDDSGIDLILARKQ